MLAAPSPTSVVASCHAAACGAALTTLKSFKVIKDLKVSINYFFAFCCIFLPENLEGGEFVRTFVSCKTLKFHKDMKKSILVLAFMMIAGTLCAQQQVAEPEFIGEAVVVNADGESQLL